MQSESLPEMLARIQREHAEANRDRPPPKVSGPGIAHIDPRPYIDGWHNRPS